MDAIETIMTRRSVASMSDRRPRRGEIELLLQAAVAAPNHHLTQPWRFVVLTAAALDELGEVMAERVRLQHAGEPDLDQRMKIERSRPRRAPVIVTAIYARSDNPKAIEREDRYAVGAAMQNILLAAHATGLAGYLRTGPAAEFTGTHEFLGLKQGEEIAGFIYLGYPEENDTPKLAPRIDPSERTEWRGWDGGL